MIKTNFSSIPLIVNEFKKRSQSDSSDALTLLVRLIRAELKVNVCSIYLLNREEGEYALMATRGLKHKSVRKVSLKPNQGLVGLVAAKEELLNIDQADQHPNYQYLPDTGEKQLQAFLGAPIVYHEESLGVLVLQRRLRERFSWHEEAFMSTISTQLSELFIRWDHSGELQRITRQDWRGKKEIVLRGIAGSPGVAMGTAVVFVDQIDFSNTLLEKSTNSPKEKEAFDNAIENTLLDLKRQAQKLVGQISDHERLLFTAYVQMLDDNNMGGEVNHLIKQGYTAISSWEYIVGKHLQAFESMSDSYLRERGSDIRYLGKRVVGFLRGNTRGRQEFSNNTILVAEEANIFMLSNIPREKLVGIVSVKGSVNSHLSILARAMDIPSVVGVDGLNTNLLQGSSLIVDGSKGVVYIKATNLRRTHYHRVIKQYQAIAAKLEQQSDIPSITKDNYAVELLVNTGLLNDTFNPIAKGATGVGLYRSETPFFDRDHFPSEEEQEEFYREQLLKFAPNPVTMRTLDVGGDKALPYLPLVEANPFLGWRGIRISLDHPELFTIQLRAMLKASKHLNNLNIMFPMISDVAELDSALYWLKQTYSELTQESQSINFPEVGVMIEVPSAIYMIEQIASRVDFVSVGSNDLTQYLLAVDRNNTRVADLYRPLHPAVIQGLNQIAKGTLAQEKKLGICGEMASDPRAIILLIAMGYQSLSINTSQLIKTKMVIHSIERSRSQKLLDQVLQLATTDQVIVAIDSFMKQQPELLQLLDPHILT